VRSPLVHSLSADSRLGGPAVVDWGLIDLNQEPIVNAAKLGFQNLDCGLEAIEIGTELVLFDEIPVHQRVTRVSDGTFGVQPFPANPLNTWQPG